MYHQNWLEEMDQIGGSSKNNSSSQFSRIRYKGGGSWKRSFNCTFTLLLLISIGSSVAYQNDLSVISNGCIWSRADSSAPTTTATTTTTSMYSAPGNNPFHHQQQQQQSPYYASSLLTSGFAGGSSSTSGGLGGVLTLNCNVRTLNANFQNYTGSFSREQVEQARSARVSCNDKLLFESILSPNQTVFQLRNLRELQIASCKVRKLRSGTFSTLNKLTRLDLQTYNVQWSASVGLEIESGAFQGLGQLQTLGLSHNNIWTLDPSVLCEMRNLVTLNISYNSITDIYEFKLDSSSESSNAGEKEGNFNCVLSVQHLDLSYNSVRRVPRSGFSRLPRLNTLFLQNNLLQELEDASFSGLNQLKVLNLSSNRLVAIPPFIFSSPGLGNLREIYLQNNSISALSPKLFAGLDQLLLLDLSRNSLTSQWVQGSIFKGLVRLMVLKLSYNELTSISEDVFSDLHSLQALYIDNNNIETVSHAFTSLKNLHVLSIANNRIHHSFDSMHFSTLFVLRQLFLDNNKIREMGDSLKNCTSLEDLGLSGNMLYKVPDCVRNLGQLKTLDIAENKIRNVSKENFSGLSQLYGLRLVDNEIEQEIPANFCHYMPQLRVLNIAQNRINKIDSNAFTACPELRALRLDNNALQELPNLAPQLPSLLWLNISKNYLKSIDYNFLPPRCEWLDLSYNQINRMLPLNNGRNATIKVVDASFNFLTSLTETDVPASLDTLRLNYNHIRRVAPDTFIHATQLRRVELQGNKIEQLGLESIKFPLISKEQRPQMYLGNNPFLCSCSMEWLTRVHQLSVLKYYPHINDIDSISCRPTFPRRSKSRNSNSGSSLLQSSLSPSTLIPLVEAQPQDFLCEYKNHCFSTCACCEFDACDCEMTCPSNCNCFRDTAWSTNIVKCSSTNITTEIPAKIPMDSTELYLDGNNFPELQNHIFIGKKNLRVLHLNGSHIETLRNKSFNGLKNLEILRLNDNQLTSLNSEFKDVANLRELYLHNNLIKTISKDAFVSLKYLQVLTINGNRLSFNFPVWTLSENSYLNSIMLADNPWSCDCAFIIPFRSWIDSLKNTIVIDFQLAKCQQQDDSSDNSSAIINSGGSATPTTAATSVSKPPQYRPIRSMCAPQNNDNPALLPSSASSSNGDSNHVGLMNNHISSVGGAMSGPYLENQAKNLFPQNENILATAAGGGGPLRRSKTDGEENSNFLTYLVTSVAVVLVATVGFIVVIVKRGRVSHWCFNGGPSSPLPKCLSAPNSSSTNEGGGTPSLGGNSGDMDYYYYSDQEKLFDAYFIYSQKDEELVTEKLTCELERGGAPIIIHPQQQHYYPTTQPGTKKLRLCLHYRDLCLPDNPWSAEMIISACNASKRVVLVLSNNFLNGEWTNNHFRASVLSAIQQHCRKLIVITLPPVSDQKVSSIFQQQQQQQRNNDCSNKPASFTPSSITKLSWEDQNFWGKFIKLLLPTGNNNHNPNITGGNFATISSHGVASSQLPYTTNLNHHGTSFVNAHSQPQPNLFTMMNWTGQQQALIHPVPSHLTPHFGYSNIDGFHNANISIQQPLHFSSSNNNRHSQSHMQQQHHPNHAHLHHNNGSHNSNVPGGHGQHILSHHLSNMSSCKSPVEGNYSSSAVSSGNEEFDHVYSTLDSPLESPCSEGPVPGQFEGVNGAQVNRHQIQLSTSSGISSASDATSGTGGCHLGVIRGPPMYFV